MRSTRSPGLLVMLIIAAVLFAFPALARPSDAAPPGVAQVASVMADQFCAECAPLTQTPAPSPVFAPTASPRRVEQFRADFTPLPHVQVYIIPYRRLYYAAATVDPHIPRGPDTVPRISRRHAVSAT